MGADLAALVREAELWRARCVRGEGSAADARAAAEAIHRVLAAMSDDHPSRPWWLANLCEAHVLAVSRGGDPADLDRAVAAGTVALELASVDDPLHAHCHGLLGWALGVRFRDSEHRSATDLAAAIDHARLAVDGTAEDAPHRPALLSVLDANLWTLFEWTDGTAGDRVLDQLIRVRRAWRSADPSDPAVAVRLVVALQFRFSRLGDRGDLAAALAAADDAVAAAGPGHPVRVDALGMLSSVLLFRLARGGRTPDASAHADLDRAVDALDEALGALPAGHPRRPGFLANLGQLLMIRFEWHGAAGDLDRAIAAGRQALAEPAATHRPMSEWFTLARSLQIRFDRSAVLADLDEAIEMYRAAVHVAERSDSTRALALQAVGDAMRMRYQHTGDPADAAAAESAAAEAWATTPATVATRLRAARIWAETLAARSGPAAAAPALTHAVTLVPAFAWHGADQTSRRDLLAGMSGLTGDAVASTLASGRAGPAVELVEQRQRRGVAELGRAVLWTQMLDSRSDLTALARTAPRLAEQLAAVGAELDRRSD